MQSLGLLQAKATLLIFSGAFCLLLVTLRTLDNDMATFANIEKGDCSSTVIVRYLLAGLQSGSTASCGSAGENPENVKVDVNVM